MEEISRSRPCVRKSRIYSALPINVGWWKNFPTSYSTYWSQVHKQSGGLSRDGTTTPNNVHQGPLIPSTSATNPEKCCSRCKARPFEHKAIRRGRGLGSSQSQFIMQQSSSTVGAGIIAIAIHHAAAAAQCVPPRVHHAPAVKVDPRTLHKYLVQESTLVSSHPFFIEGGTFRWGLNLVDPISKCTTSARRAAQPASQPAIGVRQNIQRDTANSMPSRRRSSMTTTPPPGAASVGAAGGRLFTTAASRRSASQILNLASLSSETGHGTIQGRHGPNGTGGGNLADDGAAKLCDDFPKGSTYSGNDAVGDATSSSGARGRRRSQLPANILRRMFGGGGRRGGDGTDHPSESRRGSNDTCPDDEDDDEQQGQQHQHRAVAVRDLGYDADADAQGSASAAGPPPSARPSVLVTAIPRRSSLRTESNTDEAAQRRRRRRSSAV